VTAVAHDHVEYVDRGAGQPVLFLHGNPDTSELWEPVIARLCGEMRCIAPDLPGFGGSGVPHAFDCSLDGLARWVDGFAATAGLHGQLDLVVHDIGGFFGLAWAIRHPHRVRRIVITNTIFQADYRWHFWARVWRTPLLGELSMLLLSVPLAGPALFRSAIRAGGPLLERGQVERMRERFRARTRRMVLRLYRATDPENFAGWEDQLLAVTRDSPTIVLWGDSDPYIPRRLAERFGAAQVRHLAAGHWVPTEAPDEVAAAIAAHLGGSPAGS
jgi:haloalkane dehalogenase